MSTPTHSMPAPTAPTPAWRRWSLLVPALVLTSAALLAAHVSFDGDTFRNCRYLGPSTRMYVTAWAAPVCALAALLLLAGPAPRGTPARGTAARGAAGSGMAGAHRHGERLPHPRTTAGTARRPVLGVRTGPFRRAGLLGADVDARPGCRASALS